MELIDLIKIVRKHLVLLLLTPVLMAGLVAFLTKNPTYKYESEMTLYTGIASGSSVEMDKSFNYFASNIAFDNLISIIKSRETQQEVGIRLLTQHLMLTNCDPRYISCSSYDKLTKMTPVYVRDLVMKSAEPSKGKVAVSKDTLLSVNQTDTSATFSFSSLNDKEEKSFIPESIDPQLYEKNVIKLTRLYNSSDTNFVYRLLNFIDPHYSIDAISSISVYRITSSDLIQLKYQCDDPGICQQTLVFISEVCIKNYKKIKENRSDAVVRYFDFQLKQAASKLKIGEERLLKFNKDNNIINYYEQSKAVAGVKEELDVDYNNKRIKLAGVYAVIKRLEEKLESQQLIQLKSSKIVDLRNKLGEINFKISSLETIGFSENKETQKLAELKIQAEKLKDDIKQAIGELYTYTSSVNGIPLSTILTEWMNNVIEAENTKAGLEVLGNRIKEFQKQYDIYAPAGANLKRIEREISVSEAEFLEILHGLNLAKLKMQDNELSSNIKTVDQPFFPLNPIPTKRKILVLAAAMLGFMIVLTSVFVMEFFDNTLKNPSKASKILKLPFMALFPKILLQTQGINLLYITNRMLEIAIQNIKLHIQNNKTERTTKVLLFLSTLNEEGKSVICGNLAQNLKKQGDKVLYLNYLRESLQQSESSQINYPEVSQPIAASPTVHHRERLSILNLLLGYPDARIDYNSPFLNKSTDHLSKEEYFSYRVDDKFYTVKNYKDILDQNNIHLTQVPDFVLIEIPAILYYPFPVGLIADSDIIALICRSNRVWSSADQGALDVILKLTDKKTHFILNGVELAVVGSVLGDLQKKRSRLRRIIKNLFRLQFFSKNQF